MKNKQWVLPFLACFLPSLMGVLLWEQLPDQMPIHFDAQGMADGYASKAFAVFGLPLFLALMELFCVFMMNADPKKRNYPRQMIVICTWMMPVLSCLVNVLVMMKALGKEVRVEVVIPAMVGILMVLMGNYLPKTKQNYTIGIKLPWTLNSEENWRKTNRFSGFLFVLGGLWMIVSSLMHLDPVLIVAVPVVLMTLVPSVYSWVLYRKEGKNHAED